MAIKRLQREAQFPNIGKLRKGGVRPESGKRPGEDLTYFRFDTDDIRAEKMFLAVYGTEPAVINVYLPHQTTEQNFSCWQEHWLAGGLQHRCDGETCIIWQDGGKYHTDPKPCPGGCKEVGRLMVIIPELQRFAYVTAETHSVHDIMRLTENLQAVEFLRGDLRGIPFVLKRTPVEISTPDERSGKRVTREKWLLSIEVDPAWAALQLDSMHRQALALGNQPILSEDRLLAYDKDTGKIFDSTPPTEPSADELLIRARKAFHAAITATFDKDGRDDARHWVIESYTAKNTPDNVRKSTNDLTVEELQTLTQSLTQHRTGLRQRWAEAQAAVQEIDVTTAEPMTV